MKKQLIIGSLTILSFLTAGSVVHANTYGSTGYGSVGYGCTPSYGGYGSCPQPGNNVIVNKTVQNPQTKGYVDSLSNADPKYAPDAMVNFQITILNNGDQTVSQVEVKDVFPQFVTYSSGQGSYDAASNTLTFSVNNLKANESRTFTLVGKVVSNNALPSDQNVMCVTNQAQAIVEGKTNYDNAQFCIQKNVLGAQTMTKGGIAVYAAPKNLPGTPATGPEVTGLISIISASVTGLFIRRKAVK